MGIMTRIKDKRPLGLLRAPVDVYLSFEPEDQGILHRRIQHALAEKYCDFKQLAKLAKCDLTITQITRCHQHHHLLSYRLGCFMDVEVYEVEYKPQKGYSWLGDTRLCVVTGKYRHPFYPHLERPYKTEQEEEGFNVNFRSYL